LPNFAEYRMIEVRFLILEWATGWHGGHAWQSRAWPLSWGAISLGRSS
jgi:hypothetical protein